MGAAEDEQEIPAEISDAKRPQIREREKGKSRVPAQQTEARAERRIQSDPDADDQKNAMHQMEYAGGQRDPQPARIPKIGGPANADDENWQQRGHRQQ